jgi:hypothetical protein
MQDYLENKLLQRINKCRLFSRYFGPSLRQRINTRHWFENRFIQAALRDTGWIEKHERLLKEVGIERVRNSCHIFHGLDGNDPDYDLKIFDVLAEVRLIRWARYDGYTSIEKLIPNREPTPDFLMRKDEELTVAEAKHFRERDFLPEFLYDRLTGLLLKTGCLSKFGIFVNTTCRYDCERKNLLRTRLECEHKYREIIREELAEEWLKKLELRLTDDPEEELQIVDGLFIVSKSEAPHDVGVGWGPPTDGAELMLEKLGGNLMKALEQIKPFVERQPLPGTSTRALVFLSGTDPWSIEWSDMWEALCEPKNQSLLNKVGGIHREASQFIGIPFELIVGKGNPLRYVRFPWIRKR